jgi:putative Holliday junction resolvase
MDGALARIENLAHEKKAERVYVGLPISLSGVHTESTMRAIEFASSLVKLVDVPIFVIDERLTTAQSLRLSQAAGKSARESKPFVDAEAARLIVESAIASNHSAGMKLGDYLARN